MIFGKKAVCLLVLYVLMVSFAFTQEKDLTSNKLLATKNLGISVNVGYNPGLFLDSKHIGTSFSPIGFSAKIAYIPLKRNFGNIGVELVASWLMVNTIVTERKLITNAVPLHINFVYQYRFNNLLMIDSHVGLGMSILNLQFDEESSSLTELGFSINAGVALQIAIVKDFYTEVGMDYILALPKYVMIQMFVPSVSFGYEF